MRIKHAVLAAIVMALAVPAIADNTQGITDTTIKIGNLGPFSGPQSTFTPLNYGPEAYLRYINEQGRLQRIPDVETIESAIELPARAAGND